MDDVSMLILYLKIYYDGCCHQRLHNLLLKSSSYTEEMIFSTPAKTIIDQLQRLPLELLSA